MISLTALNVPIKEYIFNWDAHLTTFWVPAIVCLLLLSIAIGSLAKDRNIRMFILFLILALCCVGYIAWGDALLSKITGLW